ncbi:hypothetical protein PR202_gb19572 [Eleusine coracana subsp. coracana]|uniref:Uncharacterized protein n=1 Tax=Eleusine coracana subsp. coracana TaxID=191504 RepID=A0AAV5F899_ELECO|nr:hypothetical protein PR202_gb19572 [Eleusine coracana subsp. coracana]
MPQSPPAPEPEEQLQGRLCTRRVRWRLALPAAATSVAVKAMEGGRGAMVRRRARGQNTMGEGERGWREEARRPIQTLPPRRKRRRWRRATGKGGARGEALRALNRFSSG